MKNYLALGLINDSFESVVMNSAFDNISYHLKMKVTAISSPKNHSMYAGGLPYLASQTTVALEPAGTVMFWPGMICEPLKSILGDCGGTRTANAAGGLDNASWNATKSLLGTSVCKEINC